MIAIRTGGLDHPAVVALLAEHARAMLGNSPPGTCHFLDLSGLAGSEIAFWTAWDGDSLAGCGAMKALDENHGEVKSMRVSADRMGHGVGHALLSHVVAEARRRGYRRLSLETGTDPYFAPAQRLYERAGFIDCAPFGDYRPSEHNRFMSLELR